jgi:GAF domain-containing protein
MNYSSGNNNERMSEDLHIAKSGGKAEKYRALIPQIRALLEGEPDQIANMANVVAALKETFDFLWVGFYRIIGEELVLAPFQGPVACTRIRKGRGVCGTAWAEGRTIIVDDVDQFPGHIACSSRSRSEIVVPWISHGELCGVLDIDSTEQASFDETDREALEMICGLLGAENG